jgi:hypothetical protein
VRVELEASSRRGYADMVVRFGGGVAWALEIGVGRDAIQQLMDNGALCLYDGGGEGQKEFLVSCSIEIGAVVPLRGKASAASSAGSAFRVAFTWTKHEKSRSGPPVGLAMVRFQPEEED